MPTLIPLATQRAETGEHSLLWEHWHCSWGFTRSIPTRISALGIDLTGSESTIITFLIVVLLYFMTTFLHRARGDINLWTFRHTATRWDRLRLVTELTALSNSHIESLDRQSGADTNREEKKLAQAFEQLRRSLGDDETAMIGLFKWLADVRKKAVSVDELHGQFAALVTPQPSTDFYRKVTKVLSWWLPIIAGAAGLLALLVLLFVSPDAPVTVPTGPNWGF